MLPYYPNLTFNMQNLTFLNLQSIYRDMQLLCQRATQLC